MKKFKLPNRITQVFTGILTFLMISACEGEVNNYNVELVFQEYVDRFIEEAAKRGQTIDFSDSGLSIQFRDAVDKESGGVCYLGQHRIEIEKFFWDDANDLQREGLIFHELGHCEFDRRHRNDLLPNGEWASRMRGDPIPDDRSPAINYTGTRKQYYTDELFDENTPFPDWASWTFAYDDVPESNKIVYTFQDSLIVGTFLENLPVVPSVDFELELEVKLGQSESWVGFQWGSLSGVRAIQIVFRGSKKFYIGSGSEVYGVMREFSKLELLKDADEFNKLTLRKLNNIYQVFVNEEFVYWFDYTSPETTNFAALVSGQTRPEYRNIKLSRITQ